MSLSALPARFSLQIEMLSDWHVGCGAGRRGDIDRLVARDADGLPFVPAKTLTGILRDACETAATALDPKADATAGPAWSDVLVFLFGGHSMGGAKESRGPTGAALSVRGARLPEDLRRALASRTAVREALTFVKPGLKIDPDTGAAQEGFLRFEEVACGGALLRAEVAWEPPAEADAALAASALFVAGTLLAERLGGKRRRGAGRCSVSIFAGDEGKEKELERAPFVDWLRNCNSPSLAPEPSSASTPALEGVTPGSSPWVVVPLRLVLETPLLVSRSVVGNVIESLDYVPGGQLLGEVTRRLEPGLADWRARVAAGDVVVTNATLEVGAAPGRPVPLALFRTKLGGGLAEGEGVHNRLADSWPPPSGVQLQQERAGWLGPTRGPDRLPDFATVPLAAATHNTVDDERQRPTSDVGGVFTYQAIAAGTALRAEVRLRRDVFDRLGVDAPRRLAGRWRLGRSSKDDYGAVSVSVEQHGDFACAPREPRDRFCVWLLSDLLLEDERLHPTRDPQALAAALSTALGCRLVPEQAILRGQRREGWNVSWGLPRPSHQGLVAGSCLRFELQDPPADLGRRLADVAAGGLGRRRAEGFGQLSFDDPLLTLPCADRKRPLPGEGGTQPLTPARPLPVVTEVSIAHAFAQALETQALRAEVRRGALALAHDAARRRSILGLDEGTKPAQLGAVRSAFGRLQRHGDADPVRAWLNDRPEKRLPKRLKDALLRLLAEDEIWLALAIDFEHLPLTPGGATRLRTDLWAEAVRTLVDAALRAQRRASEAQTPAEMED